MTDIFENAITLKDVPHCFSLVFVHHKFVNPGYLKDKEMTMVEAELAKDFDVIKKNTAPLQQMNKTIAASKAHLFAPREAWRFQPVTKQNCRCRNSRRTMGYDD